MTIQLLCYVAGRIVFAEDFTCVSKARKAMKRLRSTYDTAAVIDEEGQVLYAA